MGSIKAATPSSDVGTTAAELCAAAENRFHHDGRLRDHRPCHVEVLRQGLGDDANRRRRRLLSVHEHHRRDRAEAEAGGDAPSNGREASRVIDNCPIERAQ
jgi:hypothetical protein